MDELWWHKSVVYQIYPKSFNDSNNDGIGDLNGICEKLDYIKLLGIDVIWLSPIYESPMKDNGYDISDYLSVAKIFGSMEDFDNLILEAKKRDIRIVMDLVVNHTSNQHKWFIESKKSKDNPYRDYYIWRDKPNKLDSIFGGTAWEYDEKTNQYYLHVFAKEQPDLNWENEKIHQEVYDLINFWLDKGIGGFRLDVIEMIGKEIDKMIVTNGPRLHPLIREMNRQTFGNFDCLTVGETWSADIERGIEYSNPLNEQFSMIFQFEHMIIDWDKNLGKWKYKDLDIVKLKEIINKWQVGMHGLGWNSLFWNNHDLPRIVSRWGDDSKYRVESAKMLAILLHFMQGTPYIYQGEEIGMTNVKYDSILDYDDVEIHNMYQQLVVEKKQLTHIDFMKGVYKMSRDNARTPMQWNGDLNAGFSNVKPWLNVNSNYTDINVKKSLEDENSIFYTYKRLIELRKNTVYSNLITYGSFELLEKSDKELFVYKRYYDNRTLLVICNMTKNYLSYTVNDSVEHVVISNYKDLSFTDLMNLRPYEALVVEVK